MKKLHIAFFGTPQFATIILDELKNVGLAPTLIVTAPDKPQGRHLRLTSPPVKIWAEQENIPFIQPANLSDTATISPLLKENYWDLFIVAAYGKIIPQSIIDTPKHKTLNVHPSLLPDLRGPSPVEYLLLNNTPDKVGVTIMKLDEKMDHGPIVAQKKVSVETWPIKAPDLEKILAVAGGQLLASTIPDWVDDKLKEKPQDHSKATFSKKITKEDGKINLVDNPRQNYLKICAYANWPTAYFFIEHHGKKIRVIIKEVTFADGVLTIIKVVPEGKKEMTYDDFLRGLKN